uniref:NADH-plastoquinone oxidoreductase subunit 4L n=1 Tax=Selaginella pennata TaxID=1715390 RepID=A0A482CG94_9TRAC|nr:NADH-plastoquinone oxidoreductase subunit 4L [Selaginella pennata]QBL76229.1 NADH-plastoquinone oxidoreductase subunit 4L [Selaginella pennata]
MTLERAPIPGAFPSRTGTYGSMTSRNMARAPMRPEPIPNAVNVNLATFGNCAGARQMEGEVPAIPITAIAPAEAATGSAIVPATYRSARPIRTDQSNLLKRR